MKKNNDLRDYSIDNIVKNKICNGCGTCTVVCPVEAIKICYGERFNYANIESSKCIKCKKCLEVCPSNFILKGDIRLEQDKNSFLQKESYLINSKDENIRQNSASGGFITGILTYLLESGYIDGCIVSRCEGENPLIATSFITSNKSEVLSSCGSIYSPVSANVVIKDILEKQGRYVFVGLPCMIEGVTKLEKFFPLLKTNIVLKIALVCSGMASRLSTKKFLLKNIPELFQSIKKISYRGKGWPGSFIVYGDNNKEIFTTSYLGEDGILKGIASKDHYLRCNLCFDHFGKFADISVSDPWNKEILNSETKGKSAVLINSVRGKDIINKAIESGLFEIEKIPTEKMIGFNSHLVTDKNHPVYGWYQIYNLIFLKRVSFIFPVILNLLRKKLYGVLTTLGVYFDKRYYY